MGSVCTCSRCKEWDLQQDPVRAVHNFYSDTNPGFSEACDTNKTTPSCVCQPGSKVYYRVCVCESAGLVPRPSPPTPALNKGLITDRVLRSTSRSCVCQSPCSKVYHRECVRLSAVLVPRPSPPTPAYSKIYYSVCVSVSWPCMCVSARFEGLLQSVCVRESALLVLIQPRSTVFSPG